MIKESTINPSRPQDIINQAEAMKTHYTLESLDQIKNKTLIINGALIPLDPGQLYIFEIPPGVIIEVNITETANITVVDTFYMPKEEKTFPDFEFDEKLYVTIESTDPETEIELTVSIPYNEENLPSEMKEEDLYIVCYNITSGKWQKVPSYVDTVDNIVSTNATYFSTWTISGKARVNAAVIGILVSTLTILSRSKSGCS